MTPRDRIRLEATRPNRRSQWFCDHPELGGGGWGHPWPDEMPRPHACCGFADHCLQIIGRQVVVAMTPAGFVLSDAAVAMLREQAVNDPVRVPRDHPALVHVVEMLGDAAGGRTSEGHAQLRVVTVPADDEWHIEERDGVERLTPEPHQPAPIYTAHARAAQAAENLWRAIEAEFGLLTATEVGHLLGSRSETAARNLVGQLRRDGLLLGVERGRGVLYPGFQIDRARGEALPVIADLRRLGEKYGYNEPSIIQWLCGPTTFLDDGDGARRPVDLLAADPDRVVAVARSAWGVVW